MKAVPRLIVLASLVFASCGRDPGQRDTGSAGASGRETIGLTGGDEPTAPAAPVVCDLLIDCSSRLGVVYDTELGPGEYTLAVETEDEEAKCTAVFEGDAITSHGCGNSLLVAAFFPKAVTIRGSPETISMRIEAADRTLFEGTLYPQYVDVADYDSTCSLKRPCLQATERITLGGS